MESTVCTAYVWSKYTAAYAAYADYADYADYAYIRAYYLQQHVPFDAATRAPITAKACQIYERDVRAMYGEYTGNTIVRGYAITCIPSYEGMQVSYATYYATMVCDLHCVFHVFYTRRLRLRLHAYPV